MLVFWYCNKMPKAGKFYKKSLFWLTVLEARGQGEDLMMAFLFLGSKVAQGFTWL